MKKLLFFVPLLFLAACGDNETKNEAEIVNLDDDKDRLSYAFGAKNAESILTGDPKFSQLDKEQLKSGFESNLSNVQPMDCQQTMMSLFGPYGQDFDTTYISEGSNCIGRLSASSLYTQMEQYGEIDKLNLEMVKKGFAHGLYDQDTVNLTEADQQTVLDAFFKDLEAKLMAEEQAKADKSKAAAPAYWEAVKKKPNTKQVGSTGIYVETIERGTGGNPTSTSDFEVNYILTDVFGDTLESSYVNGGTLKMNLGSVIPGWTQGFPAMKKGGKYRLYIPASLAYEGQMGRPQGPLTFFIEFIDFGPAGSIATPTGMPY